METAEKNGTSAAEHGTVYASKRTGCQCESCKGALNKRNERRKPRRVKLPVAPLISSLPEEAVARHKRAITAWINAGGVPVYEADRMCIKYGIHPVSVYGTAWHGDMWDYKI